MKRFLSASLLVTVFTLSSFANGGVIVTGYNSITITSVVNAIINAATGVIVLG